MEMLQAIDLVWFASHLKQTKNKIHLFCMSLNVEKVPANFIHILIQAHMVLRNDSQTLYLSRISRIIFVEKKYVMWRNLKFLYITDV